MSDFFNTVKKIDLIAHIQKVAGATVTGAGNGIQRVNPCPLCDHNDCFTYYIEENTYKCFSCDSAGDIINFHRAFIGAESNLAAAKDLAEQYGIDANDPKPPKNATKKQPDTKSSRPTADLPKIPPERAKKLRAFLADYFHKQLLGNQNALDYQISKRGHSLQAIKQHRIGITDSRYMQAVQNADFSLTDLQAIGLAAKKGKSFRPWYEAGFFIYPQFAGGDVLHFTTKDPRPKPERKKYQLKRATAAEDWLCYGQDALSADDIWFVEGEDDRITLMERGRRPNTVAVIGNMNTPYMLEWIGKNAKGKTFYLAFDPDDAGAKYVKRYGPAIINSGGRALIIDLTAYQKDIDDVLIESKNPADLMKNLENNATKMTLADESKEIESYRFDSFAVLGQQADGKILLWSKVFRRFKHITVKDLSLSELIQTGGWEVRSRVSRKHTEEKILFSSLKTWIVAKAAENFLGNPPSLGQGLHPLDGNRLIVVNGDQAVIWDGENFFNQEHPLVEGKLIEFDRSLKWTNLDKVIDQTMVMTKQKAENIFKMVLDQVSQWRFAGAVDHFLITGILFAQVVQKIWDWRPQLWLSGPSGSGKSYLIRLIGNLLGDLCLCLEGPSVTEAGLRQVLKSHAYIMILDEFEKSHSRDRIIERIRSAGHGGRGAIGTIQQEAVFNQLKHMFMLASIETCLIRAAEQYRYLQVHTIKDNGLRPTIPNQKTCDEMQIKLIAFALWAIYPAKQLIKGINTNIGYDYRWILSIAIPLSAAAIWDDHPDQALKDIQSRYLDDWNRREGGNIIEDETALLEEIFMSAVRVPEDIYEEFGGAKIVYTDRTLSQILANQEIPCYTQETLETYGIKYIQKGKYQGSVFFYPEAIENRLLSQNSKFKGLKIRDILKRVEGAKAERVYFGKKQYRGFIIPEKTWNPEEDS